MSKKDTKKQKPVKEETGYHLKIKLEVKEVGNMGTDAGRYVFDATFMKKPLQRENLVIFKPCPCSPIDFYYFAWTLPFQIKGEGDLINISSNPIVVKCYKLDLDKDEDDPEVIKEEMLILKSFVIVDLTDIITTKAENVLKTIAFQYPKLHKGVNVRTWPNMPFLKCILSTSKPILNEPLLTYNRFSITIEYLINLPERILDNMQTCEAGLVLHLPTGEEKVLKCSNGYLTKQNSLPSKNVIWNLSYLDHFAKFSEHPANRSFNEKDFTCLPTNVKLQNPLVSDDSKLVAFYCEFQCILSQKTLLYIAKSPNLLAIEVFVKMIENNPNMANKSHLRNHFLGFFSINLLRCVGKTHIKSLIPLSVFSLKEVKDKCGISTVVFQPPVTKKSKAQEMASSKLKTKGKPPPSEASDEEQNSNVENDEGYAACLVVDVKVNPPIVPRRVEKFTIDDMRILETPKTHEGVTKHSMMELSFIFKREFENYVELLGKCNDNKMCRPPEGDLFGAATALLSKKFNFNEVTDADVTQNILENSYIYMINQLHNIIMQNKCGIAALRKTELRKNNAAECLVLGMFKEAEDFLIMKIRDGKSANDYVFYAMLGIHSLNLELCLTCCESALKLDPSCSICYLLQAYVAFLQKDYKTAEKLLRCGTLKNDNFVEFWLGLFVLHYQAEDKAQMSIDLRNIALASKKPYETPFHSGNFIITWKPRKYTDPMLNGTVLFLQWRLFDFAEVLLGWLVHEYGSQSFVFLYNMALIEFHRKDYTSVLQRLASIKNCTRIEYCDVVNLRVHTLLNLDIQAINQIREYLRYTENYDIDQRTSVLFLKLGKVYMKYKKYKTAAFYFKQCAFAQKTFASYILLGQAELEINHLDNAEACFKLSYQLNPFNSLSWANLAIVYSRKRLIPQFKLAARNAREQDYLDKNLADELKKIEEFLGSAELE